MSSRVNYINTYNINKNAFFVAETVEAFGMGSETTILAALMRGADGQA